MKSVVVTGTSTGIGHGTAKVLVQKGFRVFGSVRTEDDARRVSEELGPAFTPLRFDVTDAAAVKAEAARVAATLGQDVLFGLVNNAGIARPGPLLYLTIEEFREQLDVNVTGQLIVTQAFAPLLMADRVRPGTSAEGATPGRIVMISSVAGENASPFLGPYNASKFALEGLSECLRRELMPFGVDVIIIAPGAVATAIWDKVAAIDVARLAGTPYAAAISHARSTAVERGKRGLSEEILGKAVHKALTIARPRTRYVVTPDRLEHFMVSHLPKRTLDRLIAKRIGLTKIALRAPTSDPGAQ
jgi:NAD(P)-dependent dehydrogenase (short-subunit alcohol dehydrogenase family)